MGFSWKNLCTIIASAGAGAAPLVTSIIPPPYNIAVSGVITAIGSLYHLFQPVPVKP